MPYVSKKQQAFFHTPAARKKGITPAMVKEFDDASRGMKLPKRKGRNTNEDREFIRRMKGKR